MAAALVSGLQKTSFPMSNILVIEPDAEKRNQLQARFGIQVSGQTTNLETYDVIVLAVKPQQLRELAISLANVLQNQLVISIAAGIRSSDLIRWLGGYSQVVRVMPNTPAQIQAGVSALFAATNVSSLQREQATTLLAAVGETLWLDDEHKMDAVTAISGSGPAYVFYFIEALQQAAMDLGLSKEQARLLSLHTFHGASQLALQSTDAPATLRAQVTSKGGTTERALLGMETAEIKSNIIKAAFSAATRSQELGELLGKD